LSIFKSRLVVSEPFYSEYVNGKKWPERGAIYLINGVEDLKGRVDGGEYEKVVGNIAGGRFGAMVLFITDCSCTVISSTCWLEPHMKVIQTSQSNPTGLQAPSIYFNDSKLLSI